MFSHYTFLRSLCLLLLCFNTEARHSHQEHAHHKHSLHQRSGGPGTSNGSNETANNNFNLHKENLGKDFSWSNPELTALLFGGQENVPKQQASFDLNASPNLAKRAGRTLGPTIKMNCVFCASRRTANSQLTINDFNTYAKMLAVALQPIRYDLPCIFYNQRPPKSDPPHLGKLATNYACDHGQRSIWMMWPYDEPQCNERNYYCLFNKKCCWLWEVMGGKDDMDAYNKNVAAYFAAMSIAVAFTCRNDVFLMTDDVNRVPTSYIKKPIGDQELYVYIDGVRKDANPSIWLKDELPMLRTLKAQGRLGKFITVSVDGKTTKDHSAVLTYSTWPLPLYPPVLKRDEEEELIGYNSTAELERHAKEFEAEEANRRLLITMFDEVEAEYNALPAEKRAALEKEAQLRKRGDSCSGAVDAQPPDQDWFG